MNVRGGNKVVHPLRILVEEGKEHPLSLQNVVRIQAEICNIKQMRVIQEVSLLSATRTRQPDDSQPQQTL
jgi:hypothetical protein